MVDFLTKDIRDRKNHVCPYLGLHFDPGTALSYPSLENHCQHGRSEKSISMEHQENYCLTGKYPDCSEFISDPDAPLPVSKLNPADIKNKQLSQRKNWSLGLIIVVIGLLSLVLLISFLLRGNPVPFIPTQAQGYTDLVPDSTLTITDPPNTPISTLINTDTPSLALGLETPLGLDHRFIIHIVQSGESLELIARQNGTTVEAITACNYRLSSPLLTGIVIVVPVDFAEVDELHPFNVYEVLRDVSAGDLAVQLQVDVEEFLYYNAFEADNLLNPGDWVLVPQMFFTTP